MFKKALVFIFLTLSTLHALMDVNSSIDALETYTYETPYGIEKNIPSDTRLIILAFEKNTTEVVNEFFKTKDNDFLAEHKAVFIVDIHKMPKFISRVFAIPKLKKYEHTIFLQYKKEFNKLIPQKKGEITLLYINEKMITNISFVSLGEKLENMLER